MPDALPHKRARKPQKANLHDYQRDMVNFVLDHPKCGLFLPVGAGKACDDDTLLPTPSGRWVRIGDIRKGDKVFGLDGNPTEVLATYHHKNKTAIRVTLDDGRSFVCCDEHLIAYHTPADPVTLRTAQAKDIMSDFRKKKYLIPNSAPVAYPQRQHQIDPYDVGLALSAIARDSWHMPSDDDNYATQASLMHLDEMSADNVRVPEEYMTDSVANRTALLRALLRGHTVQTKSDGYHHACDTKSRDLARDIANLARSLGHKASISESQIASYHVDIVIVPSHMRDKLSQGLSSAITDMRPVKSRDMTCLTVDAPEHCFLIDDYIVTHNTLTTLEAIWELDPHCHVLLIGPKPVIRSTWPDEMIKFGFNFRVESLVDNERGRKLTPKQRHEKYQNVFHTNKATIWTINREMVADLVDNMPKAKNGHPIWPFKMVVIDEAQAFKSYNSKRFKALKSVTPQIARLVELTGTPSPNGLEDIWPLIYLIDGGQRLGPNITSYRNRWFYSTMTSSSGAPIGFKPRWGAEDEIHDLIKDVVVSLPDVATKMPALIMDDHKIKLSANERALYKELAKESLLEFTDGDEVAAPNAAVLVMKLSQLASGAVYVNGTHEYRKIHERKLEETLRIIEQAGSPVIIAYHFNSDKEMLLEYLREKIDGTKKPLDQSDPKSSVRVYDGTPEMVRQWNEGKIPVLMLQPASAGFGLNLQQGGHTLIWYTLPWSLEHYIQTNGRIYRQGQKNTTFIHRLMVTGTVDKRILDALEHKDTSQSALMRAVRLAKDDIDLL